MQVVRTAGKVSMGLGVAGFVGATTWWYRFFEPILGEEIKEASECFYQTTTKCEFGNLIGHLSDIPTYSPMALWVSVGLMVSGCLMYGLTIKQAAQPQDNG